MKVKRELTVDVDADYVRSETRRAYKAFDEIMPAWRREAKDEARKMNADKLGTLISNLLYKRVGKNKGVLTFNVAASKEEADEVYRAIDKMRRKRKRNRKRKRKAKVKPEYVRDNCR